MDKLATHKNAFDVSGTKPSFYIEKKLLTYNKVVDFGINYPITLPALRIVLESQLSPSLTKAIIYYNQQSGDGTADIYVTDNSQPFGYRTVTVSQGDISYDYDGDLFKITLTTENFGEIGLINSFLNHSSINIQTLNNTKYILGGPITSICATSQVKQYFLAQNIQVFDWSPTLDHYVIDVYCVLTQYAADCRVEYVLFKFDKTFDLPNNPLISYVYDYEEESSSTTYSNNVSNYYVIPESTGNIIGNKFYNNIKLSNITTNPPKRIFYKEKPLVLNFFPTNHDYYNSVDKQQSPTLVLPSFKYNHHYHKYAGENKYKIVFIQDTNQSSSTYGLVTKIETHFIDINYCFTPYDASGDPFDYSFNSSFGNILSTQQNGTFTQPSIDIVDNTLSHDPNIEIVDFILYQTQKTNTISLDSTLHEVSATYEYEIRGFSTELILTKTDEYMDSGVKMYDIKGTLVTNFNKGFIDTTGWDIEIPFNVPNIGEYKEFVYFNNSQGSDIVTVDACDGVVTSKIPTYAVFQDVSGNTILSSLKVTTVGF